ncbi:unnamed protein product [Discula destructiva]
MANGKAPSASTMQQLGAKRCPPRGEMCAAHPPPHLQGITTIYVSLAELRTHLRTGRSFFLEATPEGPSTIVEVIVSAGTPKLEYILPDPHRVGTTVYGYGGGPYEVIPSVPGEHQRIIFSDVTDGNALKLLDVDAGSVRTLVQGMPWLAYADFGPSPAVDGAAAQWVLAVQEDHTNPEPAHVRNDVVAVNIGTGDVQMLVSGADFYSTPRYSPNGKAIAWRWWDHPNMCWTKSSLHWAEVRNVGGKGLVLRETSKIAGGDAGEAIGEFAWGPDGALYFTQEVGEDDWRQMFRARPGQGMKVEKLKLEGLEEVEMGICIMLMDCRSFTFLSDSSMILTYDKFATHSTVHVDLETLKVSPLAVPLVEMRDAITAITSTSFLMIGAGTKLSKGAYHITLNEKLEVTMTKLQTAANKPFPEDVVSVPEHVHLITKHEPERPIYGFYWQPQNPEYIAPEGTLPPLIVCPHGGPTSEMCAGLALGSVGGGNVPFYTSRGFAYFAINYTGSTGHGKAYRQRLDGQWGVLDRDDVAECVDHLCATGRADRARVGIHGASAGGYNVLQSLVWHPDVFAAGICYCGVSDMKTLEEGTHKLELHYLETLLYKPGMSQEEKDKLNLERSPIWHAQRIKAPLLLLHGDRDTVVPIQQSFEIERRVKEEGGVVKMVVAPGGGHMFSSQADRRLALKNDIDWLMQYLVRK